jgi:hypothetical protein
MSKRNRIGVTVLSVFALTMICLPSTAQQEAKVESVPDEGVNIILARYGGMQFGGGTQVVAITRTDKDGKWAFPNQLAGSYSIRLSRSVNLSVNAAKTDIAMNSIRNVKGREAAPTSEEIKTSVITILGAQGGKKEIGWDFETKRTIKADQSSTAKSTPGDESIDLVSDGVNHFHGIVQTSTRKSSGGIFNVITKQVPD